MRRACLVLLPLATLLACASNAPPPVEPGGRPPAAQPPVNEPPPPSRPQPGSKPEPAESSRSSADSSDIPLHRLGQWSHTEIYQPRRDVFTDADAWSKFRSRLGGADLPDVDFSKETVIAVASGQQRTGGFSIAVDRVTRQEGQLTIQVVETSPGPKCITTSELTQPVAVVTIPVTNVEKWNFAERKEVTDCR
jgi:hypothetical protein